MGGGGWVAGLVENKANSARPAELELAASWGWAELGKNIAANVREGCKNEKKTCFRAFPFP